MKRIRIASSGENVIDPKFFNLVAQIAHFSATYAIVLASADHEGETGWFPEVCVTAREAGMGSTRRAILSEAGLVLRSVQGGSSSAGVRSDSRDRLSPPLTFALY